MQESTAAGNRGDFVRGGAGAGLLAAAVPVGPRPVDPTVKVGLVGCGGRGTGAVGFMLGGRPRVEVTAMGDLFQSQIDRSLKGLENFKTKDKEPLTGINVTPDNMFTGVDAYKKVIDSDVDVVLLVTPPYARPIHFEYAVKAGKNVFLEKPCATDPAGIQRMLALEDEVDRKGLSVINGFERRHQPFNLEARERIRDGAIGEVISAHAYFNTGNIWYREPQPGMSEIDFWFYNWYHVDWMSGDHIVEQHIHSPDIVNWIFDEHPQTAYGMGGRQFHMERGGNIYDHFAVECVYPSGRRLSNQARQIQGTDGKFAEDIIGTKGRALITYKDGVTITGENPWQSPGDSNPHQWEANYIVDTIREGVRVNELRHICESTMSCILMREAAYTGKRVDWDALLASGLQIVPEDIGAWDGTMRPVWKPGMARG